MVGLSRQTVTRLFEEEPGVIAVKRPETFRKRRLSHGSANFNQLAMAMSEPYRVFVVVDGNYGQFLAELSEKGPVWIVDTPVNRAVAQQIWAADPNRSHLDGVTVFKFAEGISSEDILIAELDTIDLHHGIYSANPPYTVLEVIGTALTERLKVELSEFGFDHFQSTANGFRAQRPMPARDADF